MDLAARRPHISAGIALASAAVIAAGPMTQHLPKLDVAQHLPKVSVSDINLTDATESMMDLFAGVENQLASLASGGAAAAAVPAAVVSTVANPIQTWINTFETTGSNLQTIFNNWTRLPFPVLQQVAANWLQYGDIYTIQFKASANAAVKYFFGSGAGTLSRSLIQAQTNFAAGKIQQGIFQLVNGFWQNPITNIALPLESLTKVPIEITQNMANAVNYLGTTGITNLGLFGIVEWPTAAGFAFSQAMQPVYNSWVAGDPVGLATNLLNVAPITLNGMINGVPSNILYGLTDLLDKVVNTVPQGLAGAIVTPGAQNITNGGSLSAALQGFVNQLMNGWPSLGSVVNGIGGALTGSLQSLPSILSSLPSTLGAIGTQIGTLLINLLRLL
ncbi:hypothetical protein H7K38_14425 [Mycobacterium alsense]|uniref:PE-PGRS family protein n=1 Tax=Mycobacterium alsense TaxID=324058 RepID=A0AA41XPP5_9MYCO|nr:hypothetical protein [Mycobacterium alsense]MCV7379843.1 hypothetical protein [Mycobacterium alsense]